MTGRTAVLVAAFFLAGCNPPEPVQEQQALDTARQDSAAARPAAPLFPAFAIDEVDARQLLERLGRPWNGQAVSDRESADSFTGGYSDQLLFDGGGATIYTLPNGKVWQVRLAIGFGDRCGAAEPLVRSYPASVRLLRPSISADIPAQIEAGLAGDGLERLDLEGLRVIAAGGCVRQLTLKAI